MFITKKYVNKLIGGLIILESDYRSRKNTIRLPSSPTPRIQSGQEILQTLFMETIGQLDKCRTEYIAWPGSEATIEQLTH